MRDDNLPQGGARGGVPTPRASSESTNTGASPARQGSPEPTGPQPATISLPKGGGAVRAIGEKATVAAATGTCSVSVPLPVSPGRGGFTPALALSYDSGGGNSPFGLGWNVGVPSITRKTDKGLPQYLDGEDSDVFILAGSEDLVPRLIESEGDWIRDEPANDEFYIRRYVPRTEGLFARIERWTNKTTYEVHWRTITKDNVTSLYGQTSSSRIADPADAKRVFQWMLDETRDDRGNITVFEYAQENADGVSAGTIEEHSRLTGPGFAQRYLKRVRYGNDAPNVADDFHFDLVFDYGDHDADEPEVTPSGTWSLREDPFSTYRAGFEIRTYRLCRRVLMFHTFAELGETPCLVRALELTYDESPVATKVTSVQERGYIRGESGYTSLPFPATEFDYAPRTLHDALESIPAESLENLPAGLHSPDYQWVDLDGEGLSGVLTEQAGAWFYKRNLGDGTFGPLEQLPVKPSFGGVSAGAVHLADIGGAGPKSLLVANDVTPGLFPRSDIDGSWGPFTPFEQWPNAAFGDANLRQIDLNGDGEPDLVIARDDCFVWYPSLGTKGYGAPHIVPMAGDEARGARLVFADAESTIFIGDMSGDGLADIVRIRNGEIAYWPNLGYGRFGAKITMGNGPRFDTPDQFETSRVRLADIDGSGPMDVIYLGNNETRVWFNQSGNDWSDSESLSTFVQVDEIASIQVLDLLGNGTSCLVWSTPLPGEANRAIRYIDLMGSVKPHLMTATRNNLGKETRYAYAPSTKFYLEDRAAGRPWMTKLPFPVHVIERIETRDGVTGGKLMTRYAYHHGYYDRAEKEFRGFGMVEQWDTESFEEYTENGLFPDAPAPVDPVLFSPPVLTKTWFHTGAFLALERITQQFAKDYVAIGGEHTLLPDSALPAGLSAIERREALRALRGSVLRNEIYGLDGGELEGVPYKVTEANFAVEIVQPAKSERHAVFFVHPREALEYYCERNLDDPRVTHAFTLEVDDFGHVTKSAAVAYARLEREPPAEPAEPEQKVALITCASNTVANFADEADWYRLGVPVESTQFELTGLSLATGQKRFTFSNVADAIEAAAVLSYEESPAIPPVTVPPTPPPLEKRVIGRVRQTYWKDDLSEEIDFGTSPPLESKALAHTTYSLALTADLVDDVFGADVDSTILTAAGYIADGDDWNARSGHQLFDDAHFFVPIAVVDPFGNTYEASYDDYSLLVIETTDPIGNTASAMIDYCVLAPFLTTDPNGNRTGVIFDERGVPVKMVLMGKSGGTEGDTPEDPTAEYAYYPFDWVDGVGPVHAKTRMREIHGDSESPWQESHTYWDGFGREIMKKVQAEPGLAPARDEDGNVVFDGDEPHLEDTAPSLRWIGTGRTVFNNKGEAVKKYEPFFSALPDFEDEDQIVKFGVTPVMHHDPLGRAVRVDLPDGTFTKVVFTPWRQEAWDANDTVLESEWYATNHALSSGTPMRRAADLTAAHAETPTVTHFDSLGRAFLVVADNDTELFETRTALDIQGRATSVTDARSVLVAEHTFDVLGAKLQNASCDAGITKALGDVMGRPIRAWSARGYASRIVYDANGRPSHRYVTPPGGSEYLAERTFWGEMHATPSAVNLRGKPHLQYDASGLVKTVACDFKGNVLDSSRTFTTVYDSDPDWSPVESSATAADAENDDNTLLFDTDSVTTPPTTTSYTSTTEYDALNRPTRHVTWEGSDARPAYNEAGLLESLDVYVRGDTTATHFITAIDYDVMRRRESITYGNGVKTSYIYDPNTFRLASLLSTRPTGTTPPTQAIQNLAYTYDATGNLVQIENSVASTVLFSGTVGADGGGLYEYDAIYRLVHAEGREHPGTSGAGSNPYDETYGGRANQPNPADGTAMRGYTETYEYDAVGNILRVLHAWGVSSSWSRYYAYDDDSNQLLATSLPGDDPAGPYTATYDYDDAGNMTAMPHLASMDWDPNEHLRKVDLGGGGTAYYTYDACGQRVRKVIETSAGRKERLYLDGAEPYRVYVGTSLDKRRETLRVMDGDHAVAEVDTLTVESGAGVTPVNVFRYQLDNHLRSSAFELDEDAEIIAYEEFYPHGSTSFEISSVDLPARRYRYTGMERDEETGLQRHGVRYYAPWLGRWSSADPAGLTDGTNCYQYAQSSPITNTDINGFQSTTSIRVTQICELAPNGSTTNCVDFDAAPTSGGAAGGATAQTPPHRAIASRALATSARGGSSRSGSTTAAATVLPFGLVSVGTMSWGMSGGSLAAAAGTAGLAVAALAVVGVGVYLGYRYFESRRRRLPGGASPATPPVAAPLPTTVSPPVAAPIPITVAPPTAIPRAIPLQCIEPSRTRGGTTDRSEELRATDEQARGRLASRLRAAETAHQLVLTIVARVVGATPPVPPPTTDTQVHHIIPWESRADPLVTLAAKGGWNMNGVENAIRLNEETHRGNHDQYNDSVRAVMAATYAENPCMTPSQAAAAIRTIALGYRLGLLARQAYRDGRLE